MNTVESKHIMFELVGTSPSGKTNIWHVMNRNTGDAIGVVKWAGNFRKYAFYPYGTTFYDSNCLRDIAVFLDQQMIAKK